jgi:hypothetical protein
MKRIILPLLSFFMAMAAAAQIVQPMGYSDYSFPHQVNVGNGTVRTTDPSATFQIDGTTKGFLGPRLTTTQRNAIASPALGLTIYNTSTKKWNTWNGTSWDVSQVIGTFVDSSFVRNDSLYNQKNGSNVFVTKIIPYRYIDSVTTSLHDTVHIMTYSPLFAPCDTCVAIREMSISDSGYGTPALYDSILTATRSHEVTNNGAGQDSIFAIDGYGNRNLVYVNDVAINDGWIIPVHIQYSGTPNAYDASFGRFRKNGNTYDVQPTTLIIDTADATQFRWARFVADTSGHSTYLPGSLNADETAAFPPNIDPSFQIVSTDFLIRTAGEGGVQLDTTFFYKNNAETVFTSAAPGTYNPDNNIAGTVYEGTKSFSATNIQNGSIAKFTFGSPIDLSSKASINFYLKLKAVMPSTGNLSVRFYNGTTPVSGYVNLVINKNNVTTFQPVGVNLSQFGLTTNFITGVWLIYIASNANVYAGYSGDYGYFQNGISNLPPIIPVTSVASYNTNQDTIKVTTADGINHIFRYKPSSPNSNIGSGYRLAVPNTNNVKTIFGNSTIIIDSTSNSNALTIKGDSSVLVTVTRLKDTAAAIRSSVATTLGLQTVITNNPALTTNNTITTSTDLKFIGDGNNFGGSTLQIKSYNHSIGNGTNSYMAQVSITPGENGGIGMSRNDSVVFNSKGQVNIAQGKVRILSQQYTNTDIQSYIDVYNDGVGGGGITMSPYNGKLFVTGLTSGTSTDSVLTIDPATGWVRMRDASVLGGGFTNPMTTAGDVIVGGTGGTPQRLGIGTFGYALMNVGGFLGYGAPFWNGSWDGTIAGDLNGVTLASTIMGVTHTGGTASMTLRTALSGSQLLEIVNQGTGDLTVNRSGSETIYYHGAVVTSFVLTPGQSIQLRELGGAADWTATLDGFGASGGGGSQDLQSVTDVGNTTATSMYLIDSAANNLIQLGVNTTGGQDNGIVQVNDFTNGDAARLQPGAISSQSDNAYYRWSSNDGTKNVDLKMGLGYGTTLRTIYLPDASGTIALTSDIPASADLQSVTDIGAITTNAITIGNATVTGLAGNGSGIVAVDNAGLLSFADYPNVITDSLGTTGTDILVPRNDTLYGRLLRGQTFITVDTTSGGEARVRFDSSSAAAKNWVRAQVTNAATVGTYYNRANLTPSDGTEYFQTTDGRNSPAGKYYYLNSVWNHVPMREEDYWNFFEEFGSTIATGSTRNGIIYVNSGTGASIIGVTNNSMSLGRWSTGTSTTGQSILTMGPNATSGFINSFQPSSSNFYFQATIKSVSQKSNLTDVFNIDAGFTNTAANGGNPAYEFRYDSATSANWLYRNGTGGLTSTGVAFAATTAYTLEIFVRSDSVFYWINNSQVAAVATSSNSSFYTPIVRLIKTAGTTAVTMDIDYLKMWARLQTTSTRPVY